MTLVVGVLTWSGLQAQTLGLQRHSINIAFGSEFHAYMCTVEHSNSEPEIIRVMLREFEFPSGVLLWSVEPFSRESAPLTPDGLVYSCLLQ